MCREAGGDRGLHEGLQGVSSLALAASPGGAKELLAPVGEGREGGGGPVERRRPALYRVTQVAKIPRGREWGRAEGVKLLEEGGCGLQM